MFMLQTCPFLVCDWALRIFARLRGRKRLRRRRFRFGVQVEAVMSRL